MSQEQKTEIFIEQLDDYKFNQIRFSMDMQKSGYSVSKFYSR